MSLEFLFDSENDLLALGGAPVEGVLTYKQQPGETAPANRTGNGWLVRRKWPDQASNEVSIGEYDWMWESEPTFTPATIV